MAPAADLTCAQVVELVTEYLEATLDPGVVLRFHEHLADCDGCAVYLEQMRRTITLTGRLREEQLAPEVRTALLDAFRLT